MKTTDFTDKELVTVDRLKKPLTKMTDAEFKQWQGWSEIEIWKKLFAMGQPLVYKNDKGQYVAEHANGKVDILN